MPINIIACLDSKRGIGKDNKIPWNCPADLKRFRELTQGSHILMGRNTWFSLPKRPLPARMNIILVHDRTTLLIHDPVNGIYVTDNLNLDFYKGNNNANLWIIGGGQVYNQTLHLADYLYLTRLKNDYGCDILFPEWSADEWELDWIWDYDTEYPLEIWKRKDQN